MSLKFSYNKHNTSTVFTKLKVSDIDSMNKIKKLIDKRKIYAIISSEDAAIKRYRRVVKLTQSDSSCVDAELNDGSTVEAFVGEDDEGNEILDGLYNKDTKILRSHASIAGGTRKRWGKK
jgi:hypothetical protein